jgi:dTMP kinase
MSKLSFPGILIAVEGIDGSGKSTQVRLLQGWLQSLNIPTLLSTWNSSPIIKPFTKRGKNTTSLSPHSFSLIHAADFFERLDQEILPALHIGHTVLCDRYVLTAQVRDSVRGCDKKWIDALYHSAPQPHLTFYFRVPLTTALERATSGGRALKHYEAGMDLNLSEDINESFELFQGAILQRYESLLCRQTVSIIDAIDPPYSQQNRVRKIVASVLRKRAL